MGLDITFKRNREVKCPNCGETVFLETIDAENSGGRVWYDILEKIGYYTPREKITKDFVDEWYGKDMTLPPDMARTVLDNLPEDGYNARGVERLICTALVRGDVIAVNADW